MKISAARSAQMALVKSKNTKPELFVQKIVKDLRFKFQVHNKVVAGNPDLIFPKRHKVIFVHGCFWHQHKKRTCWRSRLPKTRLEFWEPKLAANAKRDLKVRARLRKDNWKALIIWECQATPKYRVALASRIQKFLRG